MPEHFADRLAARVALLQPPRQPDGQQQGQDDGVGQRLADVALDAPDEVHRGQRAGRDPAAFPEPGTFAYARSLFPVALVVLALWFVTALIAHLGADHAAAVAWLRSPVTAIAMILLVVATFVHMALGVQVVIEDYVHHEATKLASLVLVRLACWALGAAALFAVLRVAFGS